jgi:hypothetical protein
MEKQAARRIVEMLYNYCWGSEGTYKLRNEFHQLKEQIQSVCDIGDFLYEGKDKFEWEDKNP